MDTESYVNYWSIAFRCVETGRTKHIGVREGETLNTAAVAKVFKNWRVVGFNSNNYDMPMIALAMSGATVGELKRASDEIIMADLKPWQFMDRYGVTLPNYLDHIDLSEVSPGSPTKPSLKLYAGRLHSKRMQDLPFAPDRVLSDEDIEQLDLYHLNDLDVTRDLYFELKPQLDLRGEMSVEYGIDLRSKSDAQCAEAILKTEIERATGKRVFKPDIRPGTFNYVAPDYIRYETPAMQEMLRLVTTAKFVVRGDGVVDMPTEMEELEIRLGSGVFRMGIGGLHSSESSTYHLADDEMELRDRDVISYYPSIILNNKLFPKHLGEIFLKVYHSIFIRRVAAKKGGLAAISETLKIVLNGSFGKLGSPYSVLYSPNLLIQTTLTGQLAILMLIEWLVNRGFDVVSANTDGFVTKVPKKRITDFEALVTEWEWETGFVTEETKYKALYSRDVNNYIAFTLDGKAKRKGAFTQAGPGQKGASGMKKNPNNEVCIDAVVAYLKDGTPLEQTIRACTDIRRFVTIRTVRGGALQVLKWEDVDDWVEYLGPAFDPEGNIIGGPEQSLWVRQKWIDESKPYERMARVGNRPAPVREPVDSILLGKAIRWYYGKGVKGTLKYKLSGNDVPKSEGAMPCMELPDEFPDDIDYDWYVREATAMLSELGLSVLDPKLQGRNGVINAYAEGQVTVHRVHLPSGIARCGKTPASIREQWSEVEGIPMNMRLCAKCRKAEEL